MAVLHLSPVGVFILMVHLCLVVNHELVVFVEVYLASLSHITYLLLAPTWLIAIRLVVLRLEDTELIKLCLRRHAGHGC